MRTPYVYIIEYYIKRGKYDDSIGAKKSMLILGYSIEDVKSTFIKSNKKANLIGIDVDKRQVALSGKLLMHLLQSECPKYIKAVAMEDKIIDDKMKQGKQYNSTIEAQDNYLLTGV